MGRTGLSSRELSRVEVMGRVKAGNLRLGEASELLVPAPQLVTSAMKISGLRWRPNIWPATTGSKCLPRRCAEFQIATNKYTAEVGRSSSGIINIATKSGTNHVHGSEFFFFRHKALQGLPATFDRRQPTPRFAREQFGGSLGGPFVRDKLFGFLAMEYLNQDHAVPVGVRDFATDTLTGGSAPAFVHDVRITSKGDWVPNAKDHISLRYSFERSLDIDNGFLVQPTGAAANRQQSLNRYNSVLANWSRSLSSHQVNTVIYQKSPRPGARYFLLVLGQA